MRIAIDPYSYHRFFGVVYPDLEQDPGWRMSVEDFIDAACSHGVSGVSIESFSVDEFSEKRLQEIRRRLDDSDLIRVWAWGPHDLGLGTEPERLPDLLRHVDIAEALGASVMRICAGGRRTRRLPWPEHRELLLPLLRQAADYAADRGVTLAIENHIDLLADELIELVETLAHPALGVCFDTANNLRMLEDPMEVARKLAPYAKVVHLKDVTAHRGSPREFRFWPSVPLGQGLIDLPATLRALSDARYTGLLALEIDYLHPQYGDEESAISKSLMYLRRVLLGTGGVSRGLRG